MRNARQKLIELVSVVARLFYIVVERYKGIYATFKPSSILVEFAFTIFLEIQVSVSSSIFTIGGIGRVRT